MSLQSEIDALRRLTHELLYLGLDGEPIYTDRFSQLNADVYQQSESLSSQRGVTSEEEASLCLVLLMGYAATLYNNGDKESQIQSLLNRAWAVLPLLPSSLLKCQLLVTCYGEVFEEGLAQEAHAIIEDWGTGERTEEEAETIERLRNLEENPYPYGEWESK